MLNFFPFCSIIFFSKRLKSLLFLKNGILMYALINHLKNRILKIFIAENFCQNLKVVTFVISFVNESFKTILVVFFAL